MCHLVNRREGAEPLVRGSEGTEGTETEGTEGTESEGTEGTEFTTEKRRNGARTESCFVGIGGGGGNGAEGARGLTRCNGGQGSGVKHRGVI